jgi:hypothetical protein
MYFGLGGNHRIEAIDEFAEVLPPGDDDIEFGFTRAQFFDLGLLADVLGHEIGFLDSREDLDFLAIEGGQFIAVFFAITLEDVDFLTVGQRYRERLGGHGF